MLFFSVTKIGVSAQKRAVKGNLLTSDVGVSLHKVLAIGGTRGEQVVVAVEPVNTSLSVVGDDLKNMALVLSPNLLSTQQLSQVQVWDLMLKLRYSFDHLRAPAIAIPKVVQDDILPSRIYTDFRDYFNLKWPINISASGLQAGLPEPPESEIPALRLCP